MDSDSTSHMCGDETKVKNISINKNGMLKLASKNKTTEIQGKDKGTCEVRK